MNNDVGKASKKDNWPVKPLMTRAWWYILLSLEKHGDMTAAKIADRVPGDYMEYPFHNIQHVSHSIGKSCLAMKKAGLVSSVPVDPSNAKSCKIYSLTDYGRYCCEAFTSGCNDDKEPQDFFCNWQSYNNVSDLPEKPKPASAAPRINAGLSWLYSRPAGGLSAGCAA